MANNDTIKKTVTVTLLLCIVCSVVVSTAAVLLRPQQQLNQQLDFKSNILAAAGLAGEGSVEDIFSERVKTRVVDLENGRYTDEVDPDNYDQWTAAKDPDRSMNLDPQEDIAGISRRERYAEVFLVESEDGELQTVVLPVRGYGLWSTLYGFMALEADGNTVAGLTFYDHAETPGLGGEVDNPNWKSIWEGKEVYDDEGEVELSVIKGSVDSSDPQAEHKVDGLSGATLTSKGVDRMVEFWLGDMGFKPFLKNLREGEA